jgi:hypothetical protein
MMGRDPRKREPIMRRRGYRHAVLTDARRRPLVYADTVAVIPSHPGGTVGLAGAAFAPGVLEQLSRGFPTLCVHSSRRLRLILRGVRLSFHAGEVPQPEGGWQVQAAVGTYRTLRAPSGP